MAKTATKRVFKNTKGEMIASRAALEYFRTALREVCPHDKLTTTRYYGKPYCERCCDFLTPEEYANKLQSQQ